MATLIESMIERAKADKKTIVLPEGNDDRILAAAETALADGIANIVILGDETEIRSKMQRLLILQPLTKWKSLQICYSNSAKRRA